MPDRKCKVGAFLVAALVKLLALSASQIAHLQLNYTVQAPAQPWVSAWASCFMVLLHAAGHPEFVGFGRSSKVRVRAMHQIRSGFTAGSQSDGGMFPKEFSKQHKQHKSLHSSTELCSALAKQTSQRFEQLHRAVPVHGPWNTRESLPSVTWPELHKLHKLPGLYIGVARWSACG